MCQGARRWGVVAILGLVLTQGAALRAESRDEGEARLILQTAGIRSGLCVHLGCGREKTPGLTAELTRGSQMLVHGLVLDEPSLERARQAVAAAGLSGRAIVEKVEICPLPHLRHLANLAVIEDLACLDQRGLKLDEVARIVAPGGVILTKEQGGWKKLVQPRPQGMDDWTHPCHGPDGNMVSADRLVCFPVGLRWLDGVPMNFNLWAACRGWVIAGGRCFTFSTTELENLGQVSFAKHKQDEYVCARDAFNGLPLWKVNCETANDGQALNARNTAPLATDGQRVYVYKKDRLVALDAVTGQVAMTCPVKYPSARLLLADNVLVSSGWAAKEVAKESDRPPLWSHWVSKTAAGAVEAFDARQGTPKWSVPSPAQEILAADGIVYLLVRPGNPATQQEILAVDLQSGRQRWRAAQGKFSQEPLLRLNSAGQGVLVVARPKAKAISILSAADGGTLWEINPAHVLWTPMVDGLLWHGGKKYDPKTGHVKGPLPSGVEPGICTPSAVVGNYVTATRGGDFFELPPADAKTQGAVRIHYGACRGACIEGTTPANGMFYTGQNNCRCTPGQVPGFVAFGPNGALPTQADFEKSRPIEKGPAFGQVKEGPPSQTDWPMFRHDAHRSAATAVKLPPKLKVLWQTDVARPAEGPLAEAWNARLASCLSAPVVAEGKVVAAAVDAGRIVALDAASGKPAWSATVGGRIDTPPTIHRGLCLFGSHDGWIYALRAADGQLVWRTRAAPWERRMVAFGQVESVWPALGSVLLHEGTLYATAGRTTESDGGVAVCALDPLSGRQLWAKAIGAGPMRQNDLLALRDGKLAMHQVRIDPKDGSHVAAKPPAECSLEGLIDGTWTRIGTRRSGNLDFGRVNAEMFAWNDATLFGYQCGPRSCFAIARAKTGGAEKLNPKDFSWRLGMKPNCQTEAMALCGNALLLAGKVADPKSDKLTGFLWAVSLQDGKLASEYAMESPCAYDGLAVADERVYVADQAGKLICWGE